MREFCFCNVIARTGFRQDQPIFLLRIVSFVESLFEGTEPALFTSVADIGRLREFRTHFLFIQRAERDTFTAETTVIVFGSGTKRADLGSSTVFTVCTAVSYTHLDVYKRQGPCFPAFRRYIQTRKT